MNKSESNISRWLEAHSELNSQLAILPGNSLLVDVSGDGTYVLIVADLIQKRIKTYKGIITSETLLHDIPNSLITFYLNQLEPRIPAVAVACGSSLFIYKNNKPFFKFQLPSSPILPIEINFWEKVNNSDTCVSPDVEKDIEELSTISLSCLSGRSQELVCTTSPKKCIEKYKNKRLTKEVSITTMCTLNKSSHDKHAVSCPILATESGNIYVLDPQTLTILHQANTCGKTSTPVIIKSTGLFDVDYRIIIGCREGNICILKKGWLEGKIIIDLVHDIVDMFIIPGDSFIIVATNQKTLTSFTKRGQNVWSVKTANSIICTCLLSIHHLNINLIAVGLRGGMIHLYHGRHIVDYITLADSPSVISFGQLGQEENVMVIITLGGTVIYKILKRTADFKINVEENIPTLQSKHIPLPRRSKLFLEQSLRERNTSLDMHQYFQEDLLQLRLTNAAELVNRTKGLENIEKLKVQVQVLGLGNNLTIVLILANLDAKNCIEELTIIFQGKSSILNMSSRILKVPVIPPCFRYKMRIQVRNVTNDCNTIDLSASEIKIFATKQFHNQPELTTTINLSLTENFCLQ